MAWIETNCRKLYVRKSLALSQLANFVCGNCPKSGGKSASSCDEDIKAVDSSSSSLSFTHIVKIPKSNFFEFMSCCASGAFYPSKIPSRKTHGAAFRPFSIAELELELSKMILLSPSTSLKMPYQKQDCKKGTITRTIGGSSGLR